MVNEAGGAGSRGVKKQVKYRGGENDCQGVSLNVNFFLSYLCKRGGLS